MGNLANLVLDGGNDDLQRGLPARKLCTCSQVAGDDPRSNDHERHHDPGEDDGGIQIDRSIYMPIDHAVWANIHNTLNPFYGLGVTLLKWKS